MATVSRARLIRADPETVEATLTDDTAALMTAAGFDSVDVEGDCIEIERQLGLATLSLTLQEREDEEATLAFDQEEGLFEDLSMEYFVDQSDDGTELSARTEFTLGGVTGSILDETFIRRQRINEIEDQFDYVEQAVTTGD